MVRPALVTVSLYRNISGGGGGEGGGRGIN